MRVGIDARKLWDGGIGTYIRHLVDAGSALDPPVRYTAFVDARDGDRHAWPAGCETRAVRAAKYSLAEHLVLARAATAARVELFHAPHYTLPLLWPGPAVVTIHDLIHLRFPQFFHPLAPAYARVVAGLAARRARVVLADSESARADIVDLLRVAPDRVRVAPLGVSSRLGPRPEGAVEAFRRARALPRDYLLYVGARKRHKNLEVVIEALGLMGRDRPPLVLAGDPWASDHALARAARHADVVGSTQFAGDLRDDDALACLYSGAAILVQPSLIEGFGLPPLEAMACGTPVLASDIASLRETIEGAAVLLPPADAAAWASAIGATLGDTAARYTWERTAAITRRAYEDALRG